MPIRYFCDMSEVMNVDSVEILKQLKVLHILILFEKRVVYVCDIQNHNETMKFCGCNTTQVCIQSKPLNHREFIMPYMLHVLISNVKVMSWYTKFDYM